MSTGSGDNWQDRRGMFQKGKEVHQPSSPTARKFSETGVTQAVRRASTSSTGGGSPVDTRNSGTVFPTAASGRRRSSAGSGLFGSLQAAKRGSEDYGEKRASQNEMAGGGGGLVSGWFNSTFKGVQQKPAGDQGGDSKRGVME